MKLSKPTHELFPVSGITEPDATNQAIEDAVARQGTIILLPPSRIVLGNEQPRTEFDLNHLQELALNIYDLRERKRGIQQTGFLQPISVGLPPGVFDFKGQLKNTDFQFLLSGRGENRWRSATMLSTTGVLDKRFDAVGELRRVPDLLIPVYIEDLPEDEAFELAYYENKKRRDLSPLDEARALLRIKTQYELSFRGLASRIGEDLGYVQARLELVKAGPDVQQMVLQRSDSLDIARKIDKIQSPQEREKLIQMVLDKKPTSEVRAQIQRIRALGEDVSGDDASNDDPSTRTRFGSPKEAGVQTASRFDLDDTLTFLESRAQETLSQMKNATLSKKQKTELLEKARYCRKFFEQMEEFLGRK